MAGSPATQTGTITSVNVARGFGFIRRHEGNDLFFHVRDLSPELPFDETLQERRVRFEMTTTPRGPRAAFVRPV